MKNNKLIAEFMGASFNDKGMTRICGEFGLERVSALNLKYHTSWEWLMPVCQKIDKYLEDNISLIGYYDDCLKSNDRDVRYQAVVEFINNQLN